MTECPFPPLTDAELDQAAEMIQGFLTGKHTEGELQAILRADRKLVGVIVLILHEASHYEETRATATRALRTLRTILDKPMGQA